MHTDTALLWGTLDEDRLEDVVALAHRCLATDGGMPLVTHEAFLRRRYAGPGVVTTAARTAQGSLIAVAAVRPDPARSGDQDGDGGTGVGGGRETVTGMVDPGVRGAGLGARILDWALAEAAGRGADVVSVETESLTPAVAELFDSRGLRQVFAEDIMRFDLAAGSVPVAVWPDGTALTEWSDATVPRFYAAYTASFRDRPGFPGWSVEQWVSWAVDEDFRPGWSLLATVPGVGDAGFITCAHGWIVQVGVLPDARGQGLGAALVAEALHRMRADGEAGVLLDVNVDNPAGDLYRRLGFCVLGRRARFER